VLTARGWGAWDHEEASERYTSPSAVSQERREEEARREGSEGEVRRPERRRSASPVPGAAVVDSERAYGMVG
jgi:hypothetical protein